MIKFSRLKHKKTFLVLMFFLAFISFIVAKIFVLHNHKHLNDNLQAEYDKSMISFYVDDVLTETLNSNSKYQLINYKCKNNETVAWDFESYSISVSPFTKKTQCQLYFEALN